MKNKNIIILFVFLLLVTIIAIVDTNETGKDIPKKALMNSSYHSTCVIENDIENMPVLFCKNHKVIALSALSCIIILIGIVISLIYNKYKRNFFEKEMKVFAKVFENNTEGVFITDTKGNIEWVNKEFIKITGYNEKEAKGQNIKILRSGKHDDDFFDGMWTSVLNKGCWNGCVFHKKKDGIIYREMLNLFSIKEDDGTVHFVGVHRDITEKMRKDEKIEFLAYRDCLTKLYNRTFFMNKLNEEIMNKKNVEDHLSIIFLDLDGFKKVNDTLGHRAGDQVLQLFAKRLRNSVKEHDIVARMGGDEFTILFSKIDNIEDIQNIANRILATFKKPFIINKEEIYLSASIGISIYSKSGMDTSDLINNADRAMYQAKKSKDTKIQIFSE